jgi:hypothetical protein
MTMKRLLLVVLMFFVVMATIPLTVAEDHSFIPRVIIDKFMHTQEADSCDLPALPLLKTALAGYEMLVEEQSISRPEVVTIIDFSLPSDKERLWVLDLIHAKVLYHCLVSHGRNSGELMAEYFSNNPGSFASSPGFFTTGEPYMGKHGLSLSLDGLEKGINDKARERAIVLHGADYVSAGFIRKYGRLGRSLGCPAVPLELSKDIIQTIKGGSCLFIHVPDAGYLSGSQIINKIASIKEVQP